MKLPSVRDLSAWRLPDRVGWRDHVVGAAMAVAYVAALLLTARSIGFMRDESFYFRAATSYFGWFHRFFEHGKEALDQRAIDGPWSDNHEHPVLMKVLFGFSWGYLHEGWKIFRDASTAFRFPAMCTAGMALWVTYVFGARVYGRAAGAIAALLLALMPRVFFHAHLACFDVPIMAVELLFLYAYWRSAERGGIMWAIAAGILFGLALETKHNAWELPFVVVPHALFVHRRALWRGLVAGRLAIPSSLVTMAILGPIVFVGLWPYLWNDTLARIEWYVHFHLHHDYYSIEFLGQNFGMPPNPISYWPVMVAATVPTITLALFAVGGVDRARVGVLRLRAWIFGLVGRSSPAPGPRDRAETDLLFALAFVVPAAPFFWPTTPIFGATKHWLPAYPFLALFAGRGFVVAAAALRRAMPAWAETRPGALVAGLAALVVLPPLAVTAHSVPYGLSTYVPLVGGTRGGAEIGLNRQFWGFTSQDAATEYLNDHAPHGATVFIHDTTYDAWAEMQREDRVRQDLRAVGSPSEAEFALIEHELHMNEVEYAAWIGTGSDAPVYVVTHDDVPIVSIYERK